MSENNQVLASQLSLERLREYIAGALALIIVLGLIITGYIAVQNLPNAEQFQRAKDLLLIINPFVGVVIGYYFNKVTSDARAAALQRASDAASQAALLATSDRDRAVQQAETAQTQAERMRGALTEMVTAAESSGVVAPGKLGTLGAADPAVLNQQVELRVALERARRALEAP